ncbi:MAG: hypothetical protein EOP06_04175 [Proteobacteria bacterium]|nr:MAG: hypothetical protein EOP06_04175 [Pseudomonadota bacterium]
MGSVKWEQEAQIAEIILKDTLPPIPEMTEILGPTPRLRYAAQMLSSFIQRALSHKTQIGLFGDFDADGVTSLTAMSLFVRSLGVMPIDMPSSRKDNYGLQIAAVQKIRERCPLNGPGSAVLVMMDLGVGSTQYVREFVEEGYDVLILDHHLPAEGGENAWIKLSEDFPNRVFCYDAQLYLPEPNELEISHLSAAGVVHKVAKAILIENISSLGTLFNSLWREPLRIGMEMVSREAVLNSIEAVSALAQPADVSRFAYEGKLTEAWHLAKLMERPTKLLAGLNILFQRTSTASNAGFKIIPSINAAGRLGEASDAYEMLMETNEARAIARIEKVETTRNAVRAMTQKAALNYLNYLQSKGGIAVFVAHSDEIDSGVAGIAASNGADALSAPALFLTLKHDPEHGLIAKGSMRQGPTDFHCEQWVKVLKSKGILIGGGGHAPAAGMSLLAENVAALIASAEEQSYNVLARQHYLSTPVKLLQYQAKIEPFLPFGRGHESPVWHVRGQLLSVRGIGTKVDPTAVWCFVFTVREPSSSDVVEIKVMTNDLTPTQMNGCVNLSSQPFQPFWIEMKAHLYDNLRRGVKQRSRTEYQATKMRPLDAFAPSIGQDGFSRSNGFAWIRVIDETEAEALGLRSTLIDLSSLKVKDETKASLVVEQNSSAVKVFVDRDPSDPSRIYIIKKPPQHEILKAIGPVAEADLKNLHGGLWDKKRQVYQITHGSLVTMIESAALSNANWSLSITEQAHRYYDQNQVAVVEAMDIKKNGDPFSIPYYIGDLTPLDFQYADVRVYLQNTFSLCNNYMGTGKTLEAAMYMALKISGAYLDTETKTIVYPQGVPVKPSLYVTLKGIVGQNSDELERFLKLKVARMTTGVVSAILKNQPITASALQSDEGGDEKSEKSKVVTKSTPAAIEALKAYIKGAGIVTATYDCVGRHPWVVSEIDWSSVVADEAQELKNPAANKTKALLGEEIDGAPLRGAPLLAMSGTLTKNRPVDWFVWVRLTKADAGIYSGGKLVQAMMRFETRFDGMYWEKVKLRDGREFNKKMKNPLPEHGDELRTILAPFVVRRVNTDLPPIDEKLVEVKTSGIYYNVVSFLRGKEELTSHSRETLVRHKLIDNPKDDESLDDMIGAKTIDPGDLSGKLAMLVSLDKSTSVKRILSDLGWLVNDKFPEPVVILTSFRASLRELEYQMKSINAKSIVMTQQDSGTVRGEKAKAFQNGEADVFITTYGVGGVGLNLTKSARILLISIPYVPTSLEQGKTRVHRLGQKRPVEAVVVMINKTIDNIIWDIVSNKAEANLATLGLDKVKPGEVPEWVTGTFTGQAQKNSQKTSAPKSFTRFKKPAA